MGHEMSRLDVQHATYDMRRAVSGRVSWAVMVLLVLQLVMLAVVVVMWRQAGHPAAGGTVASNGWTAQQQLDHANMLLAKGLKEQGAEALERYLEQSGVGGSRRAGLAYQIGTLYMELGRYDQALGWLYQVEQADPKTELKDDVGRKIVECLERSQLTMQARYELASRTQASSSDESSSAASESVVIARIGEDKVTMADLDKALAQVPEGMRREFETPEGKLNFAKEYVSREILFRKGQRLGYDRDPKYREAVQLLAKQLVIERVVSEELKRSVHVDPGDVRRYYEANKERYKTPAQLRLSVIRVMDQAAAEAAAKRLADGESFAAVASAVSTHEPTKVHGGEIEGAVSDGGELAGVVQPKPLWDAVHRAGIPGTTEPVEAGGAWWIVRVEEVVEPESVPPFEAIRSRVEGQYRFEKEGQAVQEMLRRVLQEQTVEFYGDRLSGTSSASGSVAQSLTDQSVGDPVSAKTGQD